MARKKGLRFCGSTWYSIGINTGLSSGRFLAHEYMTHTTRAVKLSTFARQPYRGELYAAHVVPTIEDYLLCFPRTPIDASAYCGRAAGWTYEQDSDVRERGLFRRDEPVILPS